MRAFPMSDENGIWLEVTGYRLQRKDTETERIVSTFMVSICFGGIDIVKS